MKPVSPSSRIAKITVYSTLQLRVAEHRVNPSRGALSETVATL